MAVDRPGRIAVPPRLSPGDFLYAPGKRDPFPCPPLPGKVRIRNLRGNGTDGVPSGGPAGKRRLPPPGYRRAPAGHDPGRVGVDRPAPLAPGPRDGIEREREGAVVHLPPVLESRERAPLPRKRRQRGIRLPSPPFRVGNRIPPRVRGGAVDPLLFG